MTGATTASAAMLEWGIDLPLTGETEAWSVEGFGGNGITCSVIASQIVAAEVRGGSDPDAGLYRD